MLPGTLGLEFLLLALDLATTDSFSSARGVTVLGSLLFLIAFAKSGPFLLVLDSLHSALSTSLKSCVRLGTSLPLFSTARSGLLAAAFDLSYLELPFPPRSMLCFDSPLSLFGVV